MKGTICSRRRQLVLAGATGTATWLGVMGRVKAQDLSPIRLLCGLAAGTGNDLTARIVADRMKEVLGRPVNVENKPGAAQRLVLNELRRSAPDGRTLALATIGPFAIYPHIYTKLDYDPFKDFTPLAGVASFDVGIASGPKTNARNVSELVEAARQHKDNGLYGSPGNGSLSHFVGIALGLASRVELGHVPYRDTGTLSIDLSAGRLPIVITGTSNLIEPHRQGRIRIVAVSGADRTPAIPDVPTLKQAGVNLTSATSVGIFGPAGMTPDLVKRLNAAISGATEAPEARARLERVLFLPIRLTPEALAIEMVSEHKRFAELVKASGYTPEGGA
jgi:tripartite-type tricarboxylate transporter receptor subunit TctC